MQMLGSIAVLGCLLAAAVWFSPAAAESLAAKLAARSKALRASRRVYRAMIQESGQRTRRAA
jgi:hypothetical protein